MSRSVSIRKLDLTAERSALIDSFIQSISEDKCYYERVKAIYKFTNALDDKIMITIPYLVQMEKNVRSLSARLLSYHSDFIIEEVHKVYQSLHGYRTKDLCNIICDYALETNTLFDQFCEKYYEKESSKYPCLRKHVSYMFANFYPEGLTDIIGSAVDYIEYQYDKLAPSSLLLVEGLMNKDFFSLPAIKSFVCIVRSVLWTIVYGIKQQKFTLKDIYTFMLDCEEVHSHGPLCFKGDPPKKISVTPYTIPRPVLHLHPVSNDGDSEKDALIEEVNGYRLQDYKCKLNDYEQKYNSYIRGETERVERYNKKVSMYTSYKDVVNSYHFYISFTGNEIYVFVTESSTLPIGVRVVPFARTDLFGELPTGFKFVFCTEKTLRESIGANSWISEMINYV